MGSSKHLDYNSLISGDDSHESEEGFDNYQPGGSTYSDDFEERRFTQGPLANFPSYRFSIPAFLMFLLCFVATFSFNNSNIRELLWASGKTVFIDHQYWRLLTTLFLHADIQHLLANAPLLIIFGWLLRAFFGLRVFPAAAIATGIFSNIISLLYYQPYVKLVGASGMIYGMAALWLVFYIRYETDHNIKKRVFRAAGFSMALLFPTTFQVNISYMAHAAGFFSGLLLAFTILPFVKINKNVEKKKKHGILNH